MPAQWGQIPFKVVFSYSPHVLTKKYRACDFKHSDPHYGMYVCIGSVKAFLSIEQITFLSDRRNSWHRYLPLKDAFLSATALD